MLLVLAIWYELLRWITTRSAASLPSSTLFFFGLLFVFFMLLHFSVRVSALERRLTALVQEIGLLAACGRPIEERRARTAPTPRGGSRRR